MISGQKVVCINGVFPDWVKRLYTALPVEGLVYVIRGSTVGVNMDRGVPEEGEHCVYLIGLHNPKSGVPPFREFGFKAERFRPLEEVKETNVRTETEEAVA